MNMSFNLFRLMKQRKFNNGQIVEFAESILDENHQISIRMQGYSMYPTLKAGDVGLVENCIPYELKVGDIIVFKVQDRLIAHRLVDIYKKAGETLFLSKGDKNNFTDTPFTSEALLGKINSIKRGKRILSMNNPYMKLRRFIALHFTRCSIKYWDLVLRIKHLSDSVQSNFRSIKDNVTFVSRGVGKLFRINALISVMQGAIQFVIIILIKSLVDYLTSSTPQHMEQKLFFILLLIVTGLIFLSNALISELRTYYFEKLAQSVTRHIYSQLHQKHSTLDLSNYENPDKQDKIHRAVEEASFRPIKILNALLTGIKSVVSILFLM